MNNLNAPAQPPGMTLGDIYYILFRHKWTIILWSVAGALAAIAIHKFMPPPYQSEAKLFIRYVTEGKIPNAPGDDTKTITPDQRGATVINTEVEILTSLDLAKQVADTIGPEKILGPGSTPNDRDRAAAHIINDLSVDVPKLSSVIHLTYNDSNPNIVQPVLIALIQAYLKAHVDVHESVGIVGDYLSQETDQLRARLDQTENELKNARDKAGVVSLDDAMKNAANQMSKLHDEIFATQADLAARTSALQEYTRLQSAGGTPEPTAKGPDVSAAQLNGYQDLVTRIDLLRKSEQELLTQFTEQNSRVKEVRAQLASAEAHRKRLETEYPQLILHAAAASQSAGPQAGSFDPIAETVRLAALRAKIKVLSAQYDQIRNEAANFDKMHVGIQDLKRQKELQEANYRYYAASLEQSHIDEALGAGRVSNISQIQTPSPPFRDWKKVFKLMAGVAVGSIAVGLGWAFFIELYLDRSIRRPAEMERSLRVPLFLSIPDIARDRRAATTLAAGENRPMLSAGGGAKGLPEPAAGKGRNVGAVSAFPLANAKASQSDTVLSVGGMNPALYPFFETLRDRLIGYFENKNLTHKPKLVAVSGLGHKSGVTTIASGLAGCFSETGEGNVLLVDMTGSQGSAQQFYHGKPVSGLDELLDSRSDATPVQEKLYVVSESPNSDKLLRAMPQRFTKLVSKLKASDFDYIIFDMPPVSQISVTPRLASFMDMVLLVVESEKSDRELVQRATALLEQSTAHVGTVLNKTRNYVPKMLYQEFNGEA